MNIRIPNSTLALAIAAAIAGGAWAQNPPPTPLPSLFDGTTPSLNTPGSPIEAYRLSNIDTVNVLTGRLNVAIPVGEIPGRGDAHTPLIVHVETNWRHAPTDDGSYAVFGTPWNADDPDYVSGVLQLRGTGDVCNPVETSPGNWIQYWTDTLSRLTYVAADGTETEFRDNATGGQKQLGKYVGTGFGRGNLFNAYDGSSAIFVANNDLTDPVACASGSSYWDGVMKLRNGTSYTLTFGYVTQIEDRNGNLLTINRSSNPFVITDSYGRTTEINFGSNTDIITYPGYAGSTRTVTIVRNNLSTLLAPGMTTLPTQCATACQALFPMVPCPSGCSTALYDPPGYISQINLPNGQSYQFQYNAWGDVAKLTLPTGGHYEYDYVTVADPQTMGDQTIYELQRQVVEKRIFLDATSTTPAQVIDYSYGAGSTTVTYKDGSGNVLSTEVHYGAVQDSSLTDGTEYVGWMSGKETGTDYKDSAVNGGGLLKTTTTTFQQRDCSTETTCWFGNPQALSAPAHDPRVLYETTSYNGQRSQNSYSYDEYNNVTEADEYGFGTGAAGPVFRKTINSYQHYPATFPYTSGPYIVNMLTQRQATDGSGNVLAQTGYAYDGSSLTAYGALASHDSSYSTAITQRGNVTTTTWSDPVHGTIPSMVTQYYYDIAGNIVRTLDPRGVQHDYDYHYLCDGSSNDSSTTYSLPTALKSYSGLSGGGTSLCAGVRYDYNLGRPSSTIDVNGNTTSYQYADSFDRLTAVFRPDGGTSLFIYNDTPGSLSVKTLVDQNRPNDVNMQSYLFFDGLGRESETSTQAGSQNIVVCKTYDGRGRLGSSSNPAYSTVGFGNPDASVCTTNTVTYAYDGLNRLLTSTQPDGSVSQNIYQADPATHTFQTLEIEPGARNRLRYADAAGRLVEVDENILTWQNGNYGISGQAKYMTTYAYDALDDLTNVSQAGQPARAFVYDSLKRLVQASNPENGIIAYSYDMSGNLSTRADARLTLTSSYDGLNRVTGKSYSDGTTPSVGYSYDSTQGGCNGKGRLSVVTANSTPFRSNTYCYDWAGRPTSYNQLTNNQGYGMSYVYDLTGATRAFTLPSGRQQVMTYDTAGRVSALSGLLGPISTPYAGSFAYFANGSVDNFQLGPSFLRQQYCQNNRLQVTGVRLGPASGGTTGNCASAGDLLNLAVGYPSAGSNNGNILSESISTAAPFSAAQNFTYDAYNRLWTASEGSWSQTYGYDAYGNRWANGTVLSSFTPTTQSSFNAGTNRLTGATCDAAGNLQAIGGYTFTYDGENRMASATLNVTTMYEYDGEGRRVGKIVCPTASTCNASTQGVIPTWYVNDAQGNLVAEYGQSSTQAPCTTCYLADDHLGSTRLVTNASGSTVEFHDYLPFGEEIPSGMGGRNSLYGSADGVTGKFTGKPRDTELAGSAMQGFDYFGARYFSGAMGRFTSPESKQFPHDITDPQSWNKYTYTRNNPLRYIDPDGEDWQDALKGAINSFASDYTIGAAARQSGGNGDFKTGQAIGDAVAAAAGTLESIVGGGGELLGGALDLTGFGALIGVPVNVVSAGIIAHGATAAVEGGGHLVNTAFASSTNDTPVNTLGGGQIGEPSGPKPGSSGGPGAGRRATPRERGQALQENNGNCVFCGQPATEADHAVPRSRGGNNTTGPGGNLQPTCTDCNRGPGGKHTRTTEEFLRRKQEHNQ